MKRPQNIAEMLPSNWGDGYRNVWLGITAEDQSRFNQRWPLLQQIPAVVRFISYEPAIGPLCLPKKGPFPDWLISGGESGGGARPTPRTSLQIAVVKVWYRFINSWGSYRNNPLVVEKGMTIEDAKALDNFGKGGGLVDGKLVREFPLPVR